MGLKGAAVQEITGRIWVFGDNIDTDVITPGAYVDAPLEEMTMHVLESVCPDFPSRFEKGDIIVAGTNFGCGFHGRPPRGIEALGVGVNHRRIFCPHLLRNAVALGIPVLQVDALLWASPRRVIRVNIEEALVMNLTTGETIDGTPLYGISWISSGRRHHSFDEGHCREKEKTIITRSIQGFMPITSFLP
jgi:3-isopropylmalate dehydratase small subunit